MTTDTHAKLVRKQIGDAILIGMAKGAGMIEPNLATMLSFWVTDAEISSEDLQPMLKRVVDRSYNRLSIDTDTSTSDTVAIMANGQAGPVELNAFEAAFTEAAVEMAKQIVADGEGATKLIEVVVSEAVDEDQAKTMAKSIVNSPLVKTAVYGADANWGRVAMALGKTFDPRLKPETVEISFGPHAVYQAGAPTGIDDDPVENYMKESDEVTISVKLGLGDSQQQPFGAATSQRTTSRSTPCIAPDYPPDTGGINTTSSPSWRDASQAENCSFTDTRNASWPKVNPWRSFNSE